MKETILQCAEKLFLTDGFKKVTMDIIAKTLRISKKTIYIHFRNKESLVNDVVTFSLDKVQSKIRELQSSGLHPIDEIFEIKKLVSEHLLEERSSPLQQLKTFYGNIYKLFYIKAFDIVEESIKKNFEKGTEQGVYTNQLSLDLLVRFYFMSTMGIKDTFIFPKEKYSSQYLDAAVLWYHLANVVTAEGKTYLEEKHELEAIEA